jgi:hypothetical protein
MLHNAFKSRPTMWQPSVPLPLAGKAMARCPAGVLGVPLRAWQICQCGVGVWLV